MSVCEMAILKMPEKEISIMLFIDFDVAMCTVSNGRLPYRQNRSIPSMHLKQGPIRLTRQRADIVICRSLFLFCDGNTDEQAEAGP